MIKLGNMFVLAWAWVTLGDDSASGCCHSLGKVRKVGGEWGTSRLSPNVLPQFFSCSRFHAQDELLPGGLAGAGCENLVFPKDGGGVSHSR